MNEFLAQFLIESRELVQQASEDLLGLEHAPADTARLDGAFRAFHTLKGAAGIVEFAAMARLLHAAEGSLVAIRAGERPITPALITACLSCLDEIAGWLDALESAGELPPVPEGAVDFLTARFAEGDRRETAAISAEPQLPGWVEALLASHPEAPADAAVALRYRPDRDCFFRGEDPLARIARVPQLRAVDLGPAEPWPSLDELDPFTCNLSIAALSGGGPDEVAAIFAGAPGRLEIHPLAQRGAASGVALPADAVAVLEQQLALLADPGEGLLARLGSAGRIGANLLRHFGQIREAAALAAAAEDSLRRGQPGALAAAIAGLLGRPSDGAAAAAPRPAPPRREESALRALRVEVERIEALITLAGELNIAKNALGHAARLARDGADPAALAALLSDQHARLDRLVQQLQRAVVGIRVLPMRHVFRRFPRLVRDMAQELGKSLRLVIEGEETEADKAVVETLSEPLLHVLRNAVDHGVEPPSQRAAMGKDPSATIRLRAERAGEEIVVAVEDDGAGIDIGKIRAFAAARGIVAPDILAAMSEGEITKLIFAPGLSTAAAVSEVSGRGIGMDAVRSAVERLGGRVEITNRPGQGTRVAFHLPLTVIMSQVMTIEAAGQIFGIPVESIVETVRVPRTRVLQVGAAEAVLLRKRTIPLIHLGRSLGLQTETANGAQAKLVITGIRDQLAALEVDRFGEKIEIMLKPMEGLLAGVRGIAGTSLLGDGRVLIVLDLADLIQ